MQMEAKRIMSAYGLALVACSAASNDEASTTAAGSSSGTTDASAGEGGSGGSSSTGHGTISGDSSSSSGPEDSSTTAPSGDSSGGDSSGGSGGSSSDTGVEPSPECMEYCVEFLGHCQDIPGIEAYADEAACQAACAGFAHGEPGLFTGDTVECRVDHLTFDPNPGPGYYELHCFHAQEHPTSQCV